MNSKDIERSVIRTCLIFALLLMAVAAFAGEATVTWTNPTTRMDGSAFPASAIGSTKIEWGTCSGAAFGTGVGSSSALNAATSFKIMSLAPGTYCFRAATVDTAGLQSGWSNIASKTVPASPPSPPTIVTVSTVAYRFKLNNKGRLRLVRDWSGSVPLGAPCIMLPGTDAVKYGIADGKVAICGEG